MKFSKSAQEIKADMIKEADDLSRIIREVENFASRMDIDISRDNFYIAIKAYKRALIDHIEK